MPPRPWLPNKFKLAPNGPRFVVKVAKTFGVTRLNAETLGEFRYEFFRVIRQHEGHRVSAPTADWRTLILGCNKALVNSN